MKRVEPGDEPDLADTVIGVVRPRAPVESDPDDDTLIPGSSSSPFPLVEPEERASPPAEERLDPIVATEWEPDAEQPGPPVYSIRISTHVPIPLTIPALIGRRPSAPRISLGEHANLIRVPSPSREIFR